MNTRHKRSECCRSQRLSRPSRPRSPTATYLGLVIDGCQSEQTVDLPREIRGHSNVPEFSLYDFLSLLFVDDFALDFPAYASSIYCGISLTSRCCFSIALAIHDSFICRLLWSLSVIWFL